MGDILQLTKDDIVWIDLETTGLEVADEEIIEVGVVITDALGNIRDSQSWVCAVEDERSIINMRDVVREMHTNSGLLSAVDDSDIYIGDVDAQLHTWLMERGMKRELDMPIAGYNPGFDKEFIKDCMPTAFSLFDYHTTDISTIRRICRLLNPDLAARYVQPDKKAHRAIADCLTAINEYRFYIQEFFLVD